MTFPAKIIVCATCLKATCWHMTFPCDNARTADICEKTVDELRPLNLEHPSYWTTEYYRANVLGEKGVIMPDFVGCCSWCLRPINEGEGERDTNGKLYCLECTKKHGDW